VQRLTFDELDAASESFDREVRATSAIDGFCSSSEWILPAARWLEPGRAPFIWRGDSGWAAFSVHREAFEVRIALALESMWGLSCPMVGRDRAALAREFVSELAGRGREWEAVVISGIAPDDPLLPSLARACAGRMGLRFADASLRNAASLDGGFGGFLARRSRGFRRSAARARRAAERAGLTIEELRPSCEQEARAVYDRCLAIEAKSHKGLAGDGILGPHLSPFYAHMLERLARRAGARVRVARHAGEDVGFLIGGTWGTSYRALQCSYVEEHARLSVGNLLQLSQIEDLCGEGFARYDLGSDVAYKRRWSEEPESLVRVVLFAPDFGVPAARATPFPARG